MSKQHGFIGVGSMLVIAAALIGSVVSGAFALKTLETNHIAQELEQQLQDQNNALLDAQADLIALRNQQEDETLLGDFTPVGGLTYNLAGSGVTATANTITLTSFKAPVSGNDLTMASFGDIGYMTLEPGNSTRQEFISFTGVTQNANGTAILTGVSRGLAPVYPYTASTTYARQHPGGSQASLSNSPAFYTQFGKLANDEAITGEWTAPLPTASAGLATKGYVDAAITGTSSISYDRQIVAGTAGETVAVGQVLYFDTATAEWRKASASTTASSTNVQLGIAQGAGVDGGLIAGGVLRSGYDETQTGMTPGAIIYLSNTAGATSTTAGTNNVVLGQARSSGVLYFDPVSINMAGENSSNTFTATNTFSGTAQFTGEALEVGLMTATSGETINGATLPVPVYASSTDGEYYAMDGNTLNKQVFAGFAVTNATDGTFIKVQTRGIVDGFTGLEPGYEYFLQDAVGTIATTTGTYTIKVGLAISTTELLIEKRIRAAAGTGSFSDSGGAGATQDRVIITGFRPRKIEVTLLGEETDSTPDVYPKAEFVWVNNADNTINNSGFDFAASIINVNETGFTLRTTQSAATPSINTGSLIWVAEGE